MMLFRTRLVSLRLALSVLPQLIFARLIFARLVAAALVMTVVPGMAGAAPLQSRASSQETLPQNQLVPAAEGTENTAGADDSGGAPLSILPDPQRPGPVIPPRAQEEVVSPTGAATDTTTDADTGLKNDDGIEVETLSRVDPSSIGLIDAGSNGFPSTMWQGSDRPFINRLMPYLPAAPASPSTQDLQRRLLLTAAVVPPGPAGKPSLLALRLEALVRQGDLPSVIELLHLLPPEIRDPGLGKLKADAFLLAGELNNACAEAASMPTSDNPVPFWLKLSGYCRLLEGNRAGANLAVELLQDQGVEAPLYYQLMSMLLADAGGKSASSLIEPVTKVDPLVISMIQTARLDMPANVPSISTPMMIQALATMPNLAIDVRAQAAEMAARNGTLKPEKLAEIYGAMEISAEDRETAVRNASMQNDTGRTADTSGDPSAGIVPADHSDVATQTRTNAALYQAVAIAARTDTNTLGTVLQAFWKQAQAENMLALQAEVVAPLIVGVEPDTSALPYVHEITRILLLAGNYDRAEQWYRYVRSVATANNIDATGELVSLWPLKIVTDAQGTMMWSPDILNLWWNSQLVLSVEHRRDRAALLYSVLEALGYQVPEAAWTRLVDGAPTIQVSEPAEPYWRALLLAAQSKRQAETVLLTLISLGGQAPAAASPVILGNAIRSLRAVGLDAEARSLALEALVSRNF